jgi:RsmE family RNA methyltransferase
VFLPRPWEDEVIVAQQPTISHLDTVLRVGSDAPITYTDGAGTMGEGRWIGARVIRGLERSVRRPDPSVHLAVAPPRSKNRQRFIVEKLQELAVGHLTWITTERSQVRAPRSDRATAWALGALEQSRGAWLMLIDEGDLAGLSVPVLLDADAPVALADRERAGCTVAVGPEGGFTDAELGAHESARLVPTILRTETAAIAAAVVLRTR